MALARPDLTQYRQDLVDRERLRDQEVDVPGARLIPGDPIAPAGDKRHRSPRVLLFDESRHIPARKAWHTEVGNDEVEGLGLALRQARWATVGRDDDVSLPE